MDILLVEDNPADARLVREALVESDVSAELHWVSSGEDALSFLRHRPPYPDAPTPDLVLLDLNLPGLKGQEVLVEIKHDPALLSIPVVVLTSSNARQDVLDAYRAHVNSYVVKPADFGQFLDLVGTLRTYWLTSVLLPTRVT
jgi:two-component system, chemotaxis family, response regulator Rcp1